MLFNSFIFLLGFLPVAVAGYYLLVWLKLEVLRLPFLVIMSLIFYGYWTPEYTVLLAISVGLNYGLGRWIIALPESSGLKRWLVILGVLGNLAALGYFKYANFFVDNLNAALGTGWHLETILLPLAISFYTFQQIAFLVDVGRGQVHPGGLIGYTAFVIFFPQLIAGPIVHFRELAPQLAERPRLKRALENILIGLIIFGIGLVKKTVFADTAALYASPVFDAARDGTAPGMIEAWGAAFAYTLQVYFDFSGYSDMAIGLARMFGFKLPINFHAPLRSTSITELWRRWHITLGRFVQSYVHQPLSIPLARWSAERGHGRWTGLGLSSLLPTFLAMVIIGVWHGAGWTFFIFGAMHGGYMVINEAWNFATKKRRRGQILPVWMGEIFSGWRGQVLTLIAFVVAAVPFRADGVSAVGRIFSGMLGMNGQGNVAETWPVGAAGLWIVLLLGYGLVYLTPNTQQIMSRSDPALDWDRWSKVDDPVVPVKWAPTPVWAFIGGAVLVLGLVFILRGTTEFIYFNF